MLLLYCNMFVFDSMLFMQLFGEAMGSRVAPTFSCLFMGWLEKGNLAKLVPLWRFNTSFVEKDIDDIIFYCCSL